MTEPPSVGQRNPEARSPSVETRAEPRLDPGDAVHVRAIEPSVCVRMLRNISGGGFSIVTDEAPRSNSTLYFEFATSSRLYVTVQATLVYNRPFDQDRTLHVSGWRFSAHSDTREGVATIIAFLLARLTIE